MKKVILKLDAGFAGSDTADAYLVTEEDWEIYQGRKSGFDILGNFAWQAALEHAAMYGIYSTEEMPEDYNEDDAPIGSDEYSDSMEGWFEEYDPEEHDGLVPGGGEWNFREV